jgi:hypothetical protein
VQRTAKTMTTKRRMTMRKKRRVPVLKKRTGKETTS